MASERESGREKADRSTSSCHGRWFTRDARIESEKREMNWRNAGLLIGAAGCCGICPEPAVVAEIGIIGGAVDAIEGTGEGRLKRFGK